MRTVATLTGGGRLPLRSLEIAAADRRRARRRAVHRSLRRGVGVAARRSSAWSRGPRRCSPGAARSPSSAGSTTPRSSSLQNRGSARLTSYRRARDTETYIGADANVRRWRESSLGATIAWVVVVVGILVASRTLIDTTRAGGRRVPAAARRAPASWWSDFTSAWNPAGLGSTVGQPDRLGRACRSASVLWLFRMGLGLTVLVVGLVFVGVLGRVAAGHAVPVEPGPHRRARSSTPRCRSCPGVISTGRLTALVAYAAVPWFVHLLRVAVGIGTADPAAAADDLVDGVIGLDRRERVRRTALLAIVTALAVALAPAVLAVVVVVAVVLGVTTLVVGGGWRTAAWMAGLGLAACVAAWLLNLPWSPTWSWDDLVAPALAGPPGRGLVDVASMAIGQAGFEVLALALYVPVLVALAVARAWRLTWAARAAASSSCSSRLAVLQDRDALPFARARRRRAARARRPRPGAVGRRRPSPRSATTSPGARSAGASRSACCRSRAVAVGVFPAAADDRRRRLVHARAPASSTPSRRRCRPPPRSATTACCTSATRG